MGEYEKLNEFPVANAQNIPFICLTDNPELRSNVWDVRLVSPEFPLDPIRSQRMLKLHPHVALPEFDASLYIDNTVQLRVDPAEILAAFPPSCGLALPVHSYRESVFDEFLEVARLGFDDSSRLFEQLNHYMVSDDVALQQQPYWTAIMVRDHRREDVRQLMAQWWAHLCRYSRRDQLSFNVVLQRSGVTPTPIAIDNHESWFHSWPHAVGRDRQKGARNPLTSQRPAVAQLRVLEQQLMEREAELAAGRAAADVLEARREAAERLLVSRDAELAASAARAADLELALAARAARVADLELAQQTKRPCVEMDKSTPWLNDGVVVDGVAYLPVASGAGRIGLMARRLARSQPALTQLALRIWRKLRPRAGSRT